MNVGGGKLRSLNVVIKGGKPWGFQLDGGTDGSPLTVAQVEIGGKADCSGVLELGDQVLRINDVFCSSLTTAEQLIESAFRTLTLTIWRGNVETSDSRHCNNEDEDEDEEDDDEGLRTAATGDDDDEDTLRTPPSEQQPHKIGGGSGREEEVRETGVVKRVRNNNENTFKKKEELSSSPSSVTMMEGGGGVGGGGISRHGIEQQQHHHRASIRTSDNNKNNNNGNNGVSRTPSNVGSSTDITTTTTTARVGVLQSGGVGGGLSGSSTTTDDWHRVSPAVVGLGGQQQRYIQHNQLMAVGQSRQQQQQQRRNSLGGDRERSQSFHETSTTRYLANSCKGNVYMKGGGTTSKMPGGSTNSGHKNSLSGGNVGLKGIISGGSSGHVSETEIVTENIYENVVTARKQKSMDSCSSVVSMLSVSSSSTASDQLLKSGVVIGGSESGGTAGTGGVVVVRARPAFERERRSLRKLTKDSGYETSPYSESDYANMEWLSDQNSERGLMSPSPTLGRHNSSSSSSYNAFWDNMPDQEVPYPQFPGQQRTSWTQYKTQIERGNPGERTGQNATSRSKSAVYAESYDYFGPQQKTTSSNPRRLSQGDGWITRHHHSDQSRDHILGRYSSTDSLSSSYSSGTGRCYGPPQPNTKVLSAKSTPSLHQRTTNGRLEDPIPLTTTVNPLVASMNSSRSTPNLDKESEEAMVSRKFKKASIYEALAHKSGLDFAPTIQGRFVWDQRRDGPYPLTTSSSSSQHQRSASNSGLLQPYHCRQVSNHSTASDCTSSSGNSQSHHSRQVSGQSSYSEDSDGRVLSPRSEDSDDQGFTYHAPVSLPIFGSDQYVSDDLEMPSMDDTHWACGTMMDLDPSRSPPPPIPPVRDGSSLKYMKGNVEQYDKYPYYSENGQQQRSRNVWSEVSSSSDTTKEKVAYARPKKYAQLHTQQLKTVFEKSERVVMDDPRLITAYQGGQFVVNQHFAVPHAPRHLSVAHSDEFGRDFVVQSPSEREVTPDKYHRQQHTSNETNSRKQNVESRSTNNDTSSYWWSSSSAATRTPPQESSPPHSTNNHHQETPLMDRLRLESRHWSECGLDKERQGGGRDSITSTTSSQETLKWHGSSSDVSVNSDKQPRPSAVETVVHSARVKPPQRHNSESVLYYGSEEATTPPNPVHQRVKPNKRESPSSSSSSRQAERPRMDNSEVAPPLPRKTRQWSDQVEKNNYINQIQMQVRPVMVADGGSTAVRTGSLAREEIQPPVSPEFAKPLSVAERIQDLERQSQTRGQTQQQQPQQQQQQQEKPSPSQIQQRSPYVSLSKMTTKSSKLKNGASLETRMAYLDPEKKHKVSDPELKAIQKQAVLSFFERQTGIAAHGKVSSSKENTAFISRRLAQSLPRDYFQEFKRLQQIAQSEERKMGSTSAMMAQPLNTSRRASLDREASKSTRRYRNVEESASCNSSPARHLPTMQRQMSADRLSAASSGSETTSSSSPSTPIAQSPCSASPTLKPSGASFNTGRSIDIRSPNGSFEHQNCKTTTVRLDVVLHQFNHGGGGGGSSGGGGGSSRGNSPTSRSSSRNNTNQTPPSKSEFSQDYYKDTVAALPSAAREVKVQSPTVVVPTWEQISTETPIENGNDDDEAPLERYDDDNNSDEESINKHPPLKSSKSDPGSVSGFPIEETTHPSSACYEDLELSKIEDESGGVTSVETSETHALSAHRRLLFSNERLTALRTSPCPSLSCPSLNSRCVSPDLPLPPPPPKSFDVEEVVSDEPLPPPPSPSEMNQVLGDSQIQDNCVSPSLKRSHSRVPHLPKGDSDSITNGQLRTSTSTSTLLPPEKMDTSVSPNSWEQWHNVRQSNTTLVFHSNEMFASKQSSSRSKPISEIEPISRSSKSPSRTPELSSRIEGSTESLRSICSDSNGSLTSNSCRQEIETSIPSSVVSGGTMTTGVDSGVESDTQHFRQSASPSSSLSREDTLVQRLSEATTQTTPSITKLVTRKKREEELECERLSRDLLNHLSGQDSALKHILVPAPEMKTMADYMEGLLEVDADDEDSNPRRLSSLSRSSITSSTSSLSSSSNDQTKRISGPLPSDSAYFTTSESKARFLTRYSRDMQQHHSTAAALEDVRNDLELAKKKEELVDSIGRKLKILRLEHLAIREEIRINEDLGSTVATRVEQLARTNEVEKFKLHVDEVEKITSLLLGLSGRLARAQNALMSLSSDANPEERALLEAKRNKLCEQHEEAKKLKENIDRRSYQVSEFLHKYLSSDEYADYDHFVKMKAKLLMDFREIDDKIKLGEEQMSALNLNLT